MSPPHRSPESIARRRLQTAAWRLAHPDYHQAWARANRPTENARKRAYRRAHPRDYAREGARRPRRLPPSLLDAPLPALHQGHEVLERAVAVALRHVRPDGRAVVFDPLYDDVVGAAALAIVEGLDPDAVAAQVKRVERRWQREAMPFLLDGVEDDRGDDD